MRLRQRQLLRVGLSHSQFARTVRLTSTSQLLFTLLIASHGRLLLKSSFAGIIRGNWLSLFLTLSVINGYIFCNLELDARQLSNCLFFRDLQIRLRFLFALYFDIETQVITTSSWQSVFATRPVGTPHYTYWLFSHNDVEALRKTRVQSQGPFY